MCTYARTRDAVPISTLYFFRKTSSPCRAGAFYIIQLYDAMHRRTRARCVCARTHRRVTSWSLVSPWKLHWKLKTAFFTKMRNACARFNWVAVGMKKKRANEQVDHVSRSAKSRRGKLRHAVTGSKSLPPMIGRAYTDFAAHSTLNITVRIRLISHRIMTSTQNSELNGCIYH